MAVEGNPLSAGPRDWPPLPEDQKPRLPEGHVRHDHFLTQFDKRDDPKEAMAVHCAMLLNMLHDVRAERIRHLEDVLQQLCSGEPPAKIAVQLHGVIRDLLS